MYQNKQTRRKSINEKQLKSEWIFVWAQKAQVICNIEMYFIIIKIK